ncbi:MAG: tRNA (adenosine(37)-N6)-threonylcarbamoyltransferase complex ATPase subunit type 1 TsaE [Bacteroidia bacterium]|nr:tRNA (adenosine(37)-N6)-threonylcarbamoyltransferase complex ATPase subunit type 1 TsaE [Bacteroidia bacterium]MCZ2247682.1 tRNA (adenosine(37)-N6)-threonylcarbamoyltransferase complex ATPase subunit type 1 TsaE [Bacteroidia bacterium]
MKKELGHVPIEKISDIADSIIPFLSHSNIVLFNGSMGSGKTTLIVELCKKLGVIDKVSSPTFSLVNEYKTNRNKTIYHFDFYRINSIEEALDIGVEEYFASGNLCFIEWAEKISDLVPNQHVLINITYLSGHRQYSIELF